MPQVAATDSYFGFLRIRQLVEHDEHLNRLNPMNRGLNDQIQPYSYLFSNFNTVFTSNVGNRKHIHNTLILIIHEVLHLVVCSRGLLATLRAHFNKILITDFKVQITRTWKTFDKIYAK